ncbi:MAG: AAA family ATPase [Candidatus Poribacteria bacterium]|nr:AAA family ATPase [Candidatus Poribacteria bacterium]
MSEVKDTQHPKVEIAVKNFGPIAKANIDLRPLTVFVGPSNTGKTYFATLVYALHGVFQGFAEPRLLVPSGFEGVLGILGALRPYVLKKDQPSSKEVVQDILEKLSRDDRAFRLSDLPEEICGLLLDTIKDSEIFGDRLQAAIKNYFDIDSISSLKRLTEGLLNELEISMRIGMEHQHGWSINMTTSESDVMLDSSFNKDMILIPKGLAISTDWTGEGDFDFTLSGNWTLGEMKHQLHSGSSNWIGGNRYYLPAARSGIMQSHRVIASSLVTRTTRVGLERFPEVPTMSGAIADFMERIILYEEDKGSNDEMKHLVEALESDVLAGQILLKSLPSGYPDFYYRPQGIEEDIRLSQTSSMVSELAPLVLYLRGLVNPGDTFIIEEPEAHLHPGAQADMAVVLARLVRAGVRVIITTHSDWLLQEIGNLIRVGELEKAGQAASDLPTSLQKEQVGVWHFQKDGKVEEIPYNRIDGVEPMEYLDVAEDLYNRSARLQNRLEEVKGGSERE